MRGTFACLVAVGLMLSAAPARAEKVVIAYATTSIAFSPLYVAKALDLFRKVGLDADLQLFSSGAKATAAVIGGGAQVYVGSNLSLPNARKQGADLVAFGGIVNQLVASVVVSREWAASHGVTQEAPYERKLASLKGIRAAIAGAGSGPDQVMRFLAREARLDPERDMQLVTMSADIPSNLAALQNGLVDAVILGSPAPELAGRKLGAVTLIDFSRGHVPALKDFPYGSAMARGDWLKQNPETAAKVDAGLQLALDALHDHGEREKAKAAVKGVYVTPMDDDILEEAWSTLDRTVPRTVEITGPMMARVVEFTNLFEAERVDPARTGAFIAEAPAARGLEIARAATAK